MRNSTSGLFLSFPLVSIPLIMPETDSQECFGMTAVMMLAFVSGQRHPPCCRQDNIQNLHRKSKAVFKRDTNIYLIVIYLLLKDKSNGKINY